MYQSPPLISFTLLHLFFPLHRNGPAIIVLEPIVMQGQGKVLQTSPYQLTKRYTFSRSNSLTRGHWLCHHYPSLIHGMMLGLPFNAWWISYTDPDSPNDQLYHVEAQTSIFLYLYFLFFPTFPSIKLRTTGDENGGHLVALIDIESLLPAVLLGNLSNLSNDRSGFPRPLSFIFKMAPDKNIYYKKWTLYTNHTVWFTIYELNLKPCSCDLLVTETPNFENTVLMPSLITRNSGNHI